MSKAEEKDVNALLRVCRKVYGGEITILLPREHLYFKLSGDTEQELINDLKCFAKDLFELLHSSEFPRPVRMDYRFIRQLCKVFRTQLYPQQMLLVLENEAKNQYK